MSVDARQTAFSEAEIDAALPPNAMMCEEHSARIDEGFLGLESERDSITETFALVTDPLQACRHPDVISAAKYEAAGRCYVLRSIGTGDLDKPMSCTERHYGDPSDGAPVASLRCSGWNMRVNAMVDGGFSLTQTGITEQRSSARVSHGTCSAF
ncbi:MAG: hypothetical protein AAF074_07405 [Pseudomonadota bacterium]